MAPGLGTAGLGTVGPRLEASTSAAARRPLVTLHVPSCGGRVHCQHLLRSSVKPYCPGRALPPGVCARGEPRAGTCALTWSSPAAPAGGSFHFLLSSDRGVKAVPTHFPAGRVGGLHVTALAFCLRQELFLCKYRKLMICAIIRYFLFNFLFSHKLYLREEGIFF